VANKCLFEYVGLSGATSYEVEVQPFIDLEFERIQDIHDLENKLKKVYQRGVKFHCDLSWMGERLFLSPQMIELKDVFNASTGITFYPYPESAPTASFNVQWIDPKPDFHWVEGVPNVGFSGRMHLEGTEILPIVPEDWIVT